MGLLFGKKLSDGNTISRKRVSSNQIDKEDIIEIGKTLKSHGAIVRPEERRRVEEILKKARSGGITRDEIHDELQKVVAEGGMSEEHAGNVARELGLEEKRFRYFKDVSEMKGSHINRDSKNNQEYKKIESRELKAKLDKSASLDKKINHTPLGQKFADEPDLASNSPTTNTKKPTSIWNILNRSKN